MTPVPAAPQHRREETEHRERHGDSIPLPALRSPFGRAGPGPEMSISTTDAACYTGLHFGPCPAQRSQIWIKQHLRIKAFYGTSENAVKTQIWIAIAVYVLVAIVKKRLKLEASLYTILQILSVSLFEKIPLAEALAQPQAALLEADPGNQLNLFD